MTIVGSNNNTVKYESNGLEEAIVNCCGNNVDLDDYYKKEEVYTKEEVNDISFAGVTPYKELLYFKKFESSIKLKISSIDYANRIITFTTNHNCSINDRFFPYLMESEKSKVIPSGINTGFRISEIVDDFKVIVNDWHGTSFPGNVIANKYPNSVDFSYFQVYKEIPNTNIEIPKELIGNNYDIEITCQSANYTVNNTFLYDSNKFRGEEYRAPYSNISYKNINRIRKKRLDCIFDWAYTDFESDKVINKTATLVSDDVNQTNPKITLPGFCSDVVVKIFKINDNE